MGFSIQKTNYGLKEPAGPAGHFKPMLTFWIENPMEQYKNNCGELNLPFAIEPTLKINLIILKLKN